MTLLTACSRRRSGLSVWPRNRLDASESRKITASATSSARPNRPSGMSRSRRRPSSLSTRSVVISVSVTPGRDGVDADPARPELLRERPGQADQPGLGGAVGRRLGDAHLAEPRRDVDDRAAAALDHRRQRRAAGVERRRQVGPDDRVPFGRLDLEERPDLRQAGVVDEAVDPPEALDDALDEPLGLRAVADVGGEALGLGAGRADALERALRRRRPSGGSGSRPTAPSAAALTATSAPMPRLLPVTRTTRPSRASPISEAGTGGRGGAVESAEHDLGRQHLACRLVAAEQPVGVREAAPAHLAQRQPDRRQARRGERRGRDVVEAGDRHLARDVDPERGQPLERAEREQVVRAADRA